MILEANHQLIKLISLFENKYKYNKKIIKNNINMKVIKLFIIRAHFKWLKSVKY